MVCLLLDSTRESGLALVGGVLEVFEEGSGAAYAGAPIVPNYQALLDANDEEGVMEALRSDLCS